MAYSFGVTSTGGYGALQSVTESQTAELAEVRDESGKIVEQKAYSKTVETAFEGVFDSEDTPAGAGASLTVGSNTGLITSQEITENNDNYKRISGTIQKKDSASQVAYS